MDVCKGSCALLGTLKRNNLAASWNAWHVSIPEEHKRSLSFWNNTVTLNKP